MLLFLMFLYTVKMICITYVLSACGYVETLVQMFLGYSCALRFFIIHRQRDKCIEKTFIEFILILFMRYTIHTTIIVERILCLLRGSSRKFKLMLIKNLYMQLYSVNFQQLINSMQKCINNREMLNRVF